MDNLSRTQKGQIGVNIVEGIVLRDWNCRWQAIDGHNDDGVDGLLFFQKGSELTGQVAFVQVKLRSSAKRESGSIKVNVGIKRIRKNAARWKKLVGATILIFVDPNNMEAFWVDLRDPKALVGTYVMVPESNKFDVTAKAPIQSLCGTLHKDQNYRLLNTDGQDFEHLTCREHIQVSSRKLYHELRDVPTLLAGSDRPVRFLRSGWRHITRRERSRATRFQSFVLLGCVRQILNDTDITELTLEGHISKSGGRLYSTRRYMTFPFRQSALTTVVLEQLKDDDGEYFSFYTVYEPRRKRTATSVKNNEQATLSK